MITPSTMRPARATFWRLRRSTRRYLLTYQGGGHALGFGPVPAEMRHSVWDISWFEDPVWRKERIIGINLHMITAFLDRFVKGDECARGLSRRAWCPNRAPGRWQAPDGHPVRRHQSWHGRRHVVEGLPA